MKTIYLAAFLFLNSTCKASNLYPQIDTVDFWHVFYNNKLIGQYNGYDHGNPIIIKMDSIKSGDSIRIEFFRDTPCGECNTYLIVEYPILNRTLIAHGRCTFCPLTLSMVGLKSIKKIVPVKQLFEVYYLEDTNNIKIKLFDIKLE